LWPGCIWLLPTASCLRVESHTGVGCHGPWQTDGWQNSMELVGAGAQPVPGPVESKEPEAAAPWAGRELKGIR
jgi:hypothetical protein